MQLERFQNNAITCKHELAQLLNILSVQQFRIQKELKSIISKNSYLQECQITMVHTDLKWNSKRHSDRHLHTTPPNYFLWLKGNAMILVKLRQFS
jgi:LytS/YehU family sensor histidine kinase